MQKRAHQRESECGGSYAFMSGEQSFDQWQATMNEQRNAMAEVTAERDAWERMRPLIMGAVTLVIVFVVLRIRSLSASLARQHFSTPTPTTAASSSSAPPAAAETKPADAPASQKGDVATPSKGKAAGADAGAKKDTPGSSRGPGSGTRRKRKET